MPEACVAVATLGVAVLSGIGFSVSLRAVSTDAPREGEQEDRDHLLRRYPELERINASLQASKWPAPICHEIVMCCARRTQELDLQLRNAAELKKHLDQMHAIVQELTSEPYAHWSDAERLAVLRPLIEIRCIQRSTPPLYENLRAFRSSLKRRGISPATQALLIARMLQHYESNPNGIVCFVDGLWQRFLEMEIPAESLPQLLLHILTLTPPADSFGFLNDLTGVVGTLSPRNRNATFLAYSRERFRLILGGLEAMAPAWRRDFLAAIQPCLGLALGWQMPLLRIAHMLALQHPHTVMASFNILQRCVTEDRYRKPSGRYWDLDRVGQSDRLIAAVERQVATVGHFLTTADYVRLSRLPSMSRLPSYGVSIQTETHVRLCGDPAPIRITPEPVVARQPVAGIQDPDYVVADWIRSARRSFVRTEAEAHERIHAAIARITTAPTPSALEAVWDALLAVIPFDPGCVEKEVLGHPSLAPHCDWASLHVLHAMVERTVRGIVPLPAQETADQQSSVSRDPSVVVLANRTASIAVDAIRRRLARIDRAALRTCVSLADRALLHRLQRLVEDAAPAYAPLLSVQQRLQALARDAVYEHWWTVADVPFLRQQLSIMLGPVPGGAHVPGSRSQATRGIPPAATHPALRTFLETRLQYLTERAYPPTRRFPVHGGFLVEDRAKIGPALGEEFLGALLGSIRHELRDLWLAPDTIPLLLCNEAGTACGYLLGRLASLRNDLIIVRGGWFPYRPAFVNHHAYGAALAHALHELARRESWHDVYLAETALPRDSSGEFALPLGRHTELRPGIRLPELDTTIFHARPIT